MDTLKTSFDAWLRYRLAQRGLSGGTLARRVALPPSVVYAWIHGLGYPEESALPSVAEVLGVTIGELQRALARSRPDDPGLAGVDA